ncbi:MAG: HlyD family efflux transporter periplasmic adaptor subunit [Deltaproteobacteria bacterium]|nr:HlyD family efflux transporter periplasmic adaptor subunit [Deltaproteobacteria bacterium]
MDVVRSSSPRGRAKHLLRGAAVIAALLVVAFVVRAVGVARADASARIERSTVFTDRVRRGDLLRQVPAQGTLVPDRVTWLSATSAGRVAKISVRPGAEVDVETVVVVLTNPDLELAALEAERAASSAEAALIALDVRSDADEKQASTAVSTLRAELAHATESAAISERLRDAGLASAIERADARSKAEVLEGKLAGEAARARVLEAGRGRQLAAQRAEVDRLREIAAFARRRVAALEIKAGVRGVVQDIPVESGQWVAIGSPLGKIAEPGRLKGELRVSEAEAAEVHRGLPVRFEHAGVSFRGRVDRVDPSVAKGSVRLEVAIDEALPAGVRADQTVSAWIEIETLHGVLFVNRPAGATARANVQLFRLDADRRGASRAGVRLGRASAREIEIVSGLAEGDEIVVSDVVAPEGAARIRFK